MHMHIHVYAHINAHTQACIHTHECTYMHTCMHAFMQRACIHACMQNPTETGLVGLVALIVLVGDDWID